MSLTHGFRAALLRGATFSSRTQIGARIASTAIRAAVAAETGQTPAQVAQPAPRPTAKRLAR